MNILREALSGLAGTIGTTSQQKWKLGKGDGSGVQNLTDPFPRMVWIYRDQSGEGREIDSAELDSASGLIYANIDGYENLEVQVGYLPNEKRRSVLRLSKQTGLAAVGGVLPTEQALQAAAIPQVGNLATMRVNPSSYTSPTLLCVTTDFFYTRPSTGQLNYQAVATVDFTTAQGAIASGKHRYAWAWYDYQSGTWGVTSSTDQTPSGALPSKGDFNGSAFASLGVPATAKRAAAVYLYFGQTGVAETDFYRTLDPKLDFPLSSILPTDDILKRIWLGM